MNIWVENILRFVVLLLLQVLLINNIHIMGLCNPCIYILFLISLPSDLPRWAELIIGFVVGLIMDVFCNTLGVHTAACTFVSYLRPLLIKNMIQDNERLTGTFNGRVTDFLIYVKIVSYLVVLHHFIIFALIGFSLHNWWIIIIEIILSSIITIGIVLAADRLRLNGK